MANPASDEFDAKVFFGKVGTGKTVLEFHKGEHVFEQGDVADTVFYIQKGKVHGIPNLEAHVDSITAPVSASTGD